MRVQDVLYSPTAKVLVISNALVLLLAIIFDWSFFLLLVLYLFQTGIIFLFHEVKIIFFDNTLKFARKKDLAKLNTEWFKVFSSQSEQKWLVEKLTKKEIIEKNLRVAKTFISIVLASIILPVGFVILSNPYFFISLFKESLALQSFVLSLVIFFLNHLFSFLYYLRSDEKKTYVGEQAKLLARVGTLLVCFILIGLFVMIFVMTEVWFGVYFGFILSNFVFVVLFSLGKTFFDVKAHLEEHTAEEDAL